MKTVVGGAYLPKYKPVFGAAYRLKYEAINKLWDRSVSTMKPLCRRAVHSGLDDALHLVLLACQRCHEDPSRRIGSRL
jgi:hypothetical protein